MGHSTGYQYQETLMFQAPSCHSEQNTVAGRRTSMFASPSLFCGIATLGALPAYNKANGVEHPSRYLESP